jgi:hypothetical protein
VSSNARSWLRLAARTLLLLGSLLLLVEFCEFFTGVGGAPGIDPQPDPAAQIELPNRRTHLQARAFLAGQSHLPVEPDPRLLALLEDAGRRGAELAYPLQGEFHYLWDGLLRDGKYYNYWGPLPALIVAACYAVFGPGLELEDRVVGKWSGVLCVLAAGLLLLRIRRAFCPDLPLAHTGVFLATALAMHPLPFCLARPWAYEVAILSGQLFVLLGFCGLVPIFAGRSSRVASWASATAFACAVACRFSLIVPLGVVLAVTAWRLRSRPRRDLARAVAALSAPTIGVVLALMYYNAVRFGHPLDFGVDYQLGVGRFRTGSEYVLANLWNHVFRLPRITDFPYFDLDQVPSEYPGFVPRPDHYYDDESMVGLLWAMPILWLIPVWAARASVRRRRSPPGSTALLLALCAFAVVSLAMLLTVWATVVRYALDYSLILLVMAFLAAALLHRELGQRAWRTLWILAVWLLAILTCCIGINYGFEAPWSFRTFNPSLYGFYRSLF